MHTMQTFRYFLQSFVSFLLLSAAALAQSKPIILNVTVVPPYAATLAEWDRHPERIIITLTNTDPATSYSVRLSGTLQDNIGGIKVTTNDDYPVTAITVPAGGVRTVNGSELKIFNANAVSISGSDKGAVARSGQLNEGTYTICLKALDHSTKSELSPAAGCASFTIRTVEAPKLTAPPCNMSITQTVDPQLLLLQWTPPAGAAGGITYTLTLAEVIPDDRNPEEALLAATSPTLFKKEGLTAPIYQYGAADPQLKKGKKYAWRVQAIDPTAATNFRNDGKSEVCTFTYGDSTQPKVEDPDCKKPTYITAAYPKDDIRIPYRFVPAVAQFAPYCSDLKKFTSTFVLKDNNGVQVQSQNRTIEWEHGPFNNPSRKPDMFEKNRASYVVVGPDQNEKPADRKDQFLSPEKSYTWSAEITINKNTGKDSGDTKRKITGRFQVGMGAPVLNEPSNGATVLPDTVTLRFLTSNPIDKSALTLPFDLTAEPKGGGAKFYQMAVNEKWVLEIARTPDMKNPVFRDTGRIGGPLVDALSPTTSAALLQKEIYRQETVRPKLTKTGEYYWQVKWMVDPNDGNDTTGKFYNSSPVQRFVVDPNANCFNLAAEFPKDQSAIEEGRPTFKVRVSNSVKPAEITEGELRIWRGKTAADTTPANLVRDLNFSRSAKTAGGAMRDTDGNGVPYLNIVGDVIHFRVNDAGVPVEFVANDKQDYVWQLRLKHSQSVRMDGQPCNRTATASPLFSFRKDMGCIALTNIWPANGDMATDTSELLAKISKPIRLANTTQRTWEIYELRPGEDPRSVVLKDGREYFTLQKQTDDVYAPEATTSLIGYKIPAIITALEQQGKALKVGQRYGWRIRLSYNGAGIFADGSDCGQQEATVESTPTSFVYGGCVTIKNILPADGATINDRDGELQVRVSKAFRIANTVSREWEVFALKADEQANMVDPNDGRQHHSLMLATADVYSPDASTSLMAIRIRTLFQQLAEQGNALKPGQRYGWRIRLKANADQFLVDGSDCGGGMITLQSVPTSFLYSGCVAATNTSPAEGEIATDSTGEFLVKLSKKIRFGSVKRRVLVLCQLKPGEEASKVDFGDGRFTYESDFPFATQRDPNAFNDLMAIYLKTVVQKMPKGTPLITGERYAWKLKLYFDGDKAIEGGESCAKDAVVESTPTSFIYGGCLAMRNISPVGGITAADGDELTAMFSQKVKANNIAGHIYELCQLVGQEDSLTLLMKSEFDLLRYDASINDLLHAGSISDRYAMPIERLNKELAKQGKSLKIGARYAWRIRVQFDGNGIFADGGSCGGANAELVTRPTTFIYGGCFAVTGTTPKSGDTVSGVPNFTFRTAPVVDPNDFTSVALKIWKKKSGQSVEDAAKGTPIYDHLAGDGNGVGVQKNLGDGMSATKLAFYFEPMDKTQKMPTEWRIVMGDDKFKFRTEAEQEYVWKVETTIFTPDSVACKRDATSPAMAFIGGGNDCLTMKNAYPADGAVMTDAEEFRAPLNASVKTAAVSKREIVFAAMKEGEKVEEIDFQKPEGRTVITYDIPIDRSKAPETFSLLAGMVGKYNAALPAAKKLKQGERYAWFYRITYNGEHALADGSSCGGPNSVLESDPTTFIYGGCRYIVPLTPKEGENVEKQPKFTVRISPAVDPKDWGQVELFIWKKSAGQSAADAATGTAIYNKLFVEPSRAGETRTMNGVEVTTSGDYVIAPLNLANGKATDWELRMTQDSSRFKPEEGMEYAWKLTTDQFTKPEDTCGSQAATALATFGYKKSADDETCLIVKAGTPEPGGVHDLNDKPVFNVIVQEGIRKEGITGGRLQVWKLKQFQKIDSVVKDAPIFDESFAGNDSTNVRIVANTANTTGLELAFVNTKDAKKTFQLKDFGATYVWRFTLKIDGKEILQDRSATCTEDAIVGKLAAFEYQAPSKNNCDDGGTGTEAPDISDKTPSKAPSFVGTSIKVGLFRMNVTEASGDGAGLSGKGTIQMKSLKGPIKVEFSGIKVNSDNAMYDGVVKAVMDVQNSTITSLVNAVGRKMDLDQGKAEAIDQAIQSGKRLVSMLVSSDPIGLPIGFDANVEGKNYTLGIIGMSFTPKKGTMACAFRLETPDLTNGQSTNFIDFGARDLVFTPSSFGASNGTMKLYVAGDFTLQLGGGMALKLNAPKESELDDDNKGTYVKLKCGKFDGLRIDASAIFPREWLVPRNADGTANTDETKKVQANFVAQIRDWNNWMAKVNLDKCFIASNDGFGLEVQEMAYDHSDVVNPEGIKFPDGYTKDRSNLWRGFYIKRAAISLPTEWSATDQEGKGISFAVEHLLVDKTGLSANFMVENVVNYGKLAGWGFTLDKIGVEIVSSSFKKGYLNGSFKTPIADESMYYSALIQQGKNAATGKSQLQWQFQLKIEENKPLKATFWKAALHLKPGSNITIGNVAGQGKFNAKADLTGHFSIDYEEYKLKMEGLRFENLVVQSNPPKGEKRFSYKAFSFTSPPKKMGGFPLSIENIEFATDDASIGLKFDLTLALAGDKTSIGGKLGLMVKAKLNLDAKEWGQKLEFDGIDLTKIAVEADMGAVKIKGLIEFYKKDATFGDGFRGIVECWILKNIYVGVTVQFGTKPSAINPGEDFRYWYVDAMARFNPGIVLGPAIGIYGFGGGAWYHMAPKNQLDPTLLMKAPENSDASKNGLPSKVGATLSGEEYVPNEGTLFGFKASVTIGTVPDPKPVNADVQLSISFTSSGGLERIRFDGSLYMACDVIERKDPALKASVSILYDNVNKIFHAAFEIDLDFKVVKAHIPAVIHVEPKWWQVKLGEPKNRMTLDVNLAVIKMKFKSYIMAGDSLPPLPDPPDEVLNKLTAEQKEKIKSKPMIGRSASGFMFGTIFQVGPIGGEFLIFYGSLDLGVGFDVEVKQFKGMSCGNSEGGGQIGFNDGWYAQGQAYAWIDASIGIKIKLFGAERKFPIIAFSGAALLRMGLPNPTWFEGYLAAKYEILFGLIKGTCHYEFSVGDQCRPRKGDPFTESVPMIEDISPKAGATNIPVLVTPEVSHNFPLGTPFELKDLNDEKIVHTYRILDRDPVMTYAPPGGGTITEPTSITWSQGSRASQISPQNMLNGYQQYKLSIAAYAEEYAPNRSTLGGTWAPATYPNPNDPSKLDPIADQTEETYFTTGPQPDYIPWDNVEYATPGARQRYFRTDHPGPYNLGTNGFIQLRRDQGYLLTEKSDGVVQQKLKVRFIPRGGTGGDTIVEDVRYYPAFYRQKAGLSFSVARLSTSTLYRMDVFRETSYLAGKAGQASQLLEKIDTTTFTAVVEESGGAETDAQTRMVRATLERENRKLGGIRVNPLTGAQEKMLWYNDFATSAYTTLQGKMMGVRAKRVDRQSDRRLVFHYDSFEPFDGYDINEVAVEANVPGDWNYNVFMRNIQSRILQYDVPKPPAYTGYFYHLGYYYTNGRRVEWNRVQNLPMTRYIGENLQDAAYQVPAWLAYIDRSCAVEPIADWELASGTLNPNPRSRWSYGQGGCWECGPERFPNGTPGTLWVQYRYEEHAWNLGMRMVNAASQAYSMAVWGEYQWFRTASGRSEQLLIKTEYWDDFLKPYWYLHLGQLEYDRSALSRFYSLPQGWYQMNFFESRGETFESVTRNPRSMMWQYNNTTYTYSRAGGL